eukprot:1188540-Prorocentrum_minimum.AAC.3
MTCALAKDDQMWEKSVATVKARSLGFTLPKRWGISSKGSSEVLRVRADGRASEGERGTNDG